MYSAFFKVNQWQLTPEH